MSFITVLAGIDNVLLYQMGKKAPQLFIFGGDKANLVPPVPTNRNQDPPLVVLNRGPLSQLRILAV